MATFGSGAKERVQTINFSGWQRLSVFTAQFYKYFAFFMYLTKLFVYQSWYKNIKFTNTLTLQAL